MEHFFNAAPGSRVKRELPAGEAGTLPVWILQGLQEGPTLVVTAGVHGCEYVGMMTARKLLEQTALETLKGRLVILPLVNKEGFLAGAKQIMPGDGKNINRVFPAPEHGTASEQIARAIQDHIYPEADFLVDLHGGDVNEDMTPLVFFPKGLEMTPYVRQAASHLDVGVRIPSTADNGLYSCAARNFKIPAMLIEIGGQGLWSEKEVDRCFRSILSLMGFLGMGPEAKLNGFQKEALESRYEEASSEGMWHSTVFAGAKFHSGDLLGTLRDLDGEAIQEIRAPFDGMVWYHTLALGVRSGDPLIAYGRCE